MHLNLSSLNILQTGFYIFRAGKVIDSSDGGVIEVCSLQLDDQSWILDSVGKTEAWCEYQVWTSIWTQTRIIHGLCESPPAYSMSCHETHKYYYADFFPQKGWVSPPFWWNFSGIKVAHFPQGGVGYPLFPQLFRQKKFCKGVGESPLLCPVGGRRGGVSLSY